jgi:hypothetical protein
MIPVTDTGRLGRLGEMPDMHTPVPLLFTAEEYLKLDIPERTELLGGVIYEVSPRNEPHRYAVAALHDVLAFALHRSEYVVRSQDAVAVPGWGGRDAPEVDVAVLRRKRYDLGPTAADAIALIEVSDTTYAHDRSYKIPLYVAAGVEAWLVNIPARTVERYATFEDLGRPHGFEYGEGQTFHVAGTPISVSELF